MGIIEMQIFHVAYMLQNRVWTADRLLLREWPNFYFCQLCYKNLETAIHLFIDCLVSRSIWAEISIWGHSPGFNPASWTTAGDLSS